MHRVGGGCSRSVDSQRSPRRTRRSPPAGHHVSAAHGPTRVTPLLPEGPGWPALRGQEADRRLFHLKLASMRAEEVGLAVDAIPPVLALHHATGTCRTECSDAQTRSGQRVDDVRHGVLPLVRRPVPGGRGPVGVDRPSSPRSPDIEVGVGRDQFAITLGEDAPDEVLLHDVEEARGSSSLPMASPHRARRAHAVGREDDGAGEMFGQLVPHRRDVGLRRQTARHLD